MASLLKKIKLWPYKHLVVGSLFGIVAIVLSLVFISFNPQDQSWLYFSSDFRPTTNLLGSFGSQIAAFFFYGFGVSCWAVVFFLFYSFYFLFFSVKIKQKLDQFIALFFLPVLGSSLLYLYSYDFFSGVLPGGVVGSGFYNIVVKMFDPIGAGLFLHLLFLISMILIFPNFFVFLLQVIHTLLNFLMNREKFLQPAYRVSKKIAYVVSVPFVFSFNFIKKLFDGEDVKESGQSIVSFEQQLVDEVESGDVKDDIFWKEYFGSKDDSFSAASETSESSSFIDSELISSEHPEVSSESIEGYKNVSSKKESLYKLPNKNIFREIGNDNDKKKMMTELEKRAKILEEKLERFGVQGKVISIKRGPVVTLFEYRPDIDSKISKIISLEDDLALALQALSIRIIAPIPGKSVVGFEVANKTRNNVMLSSLIRSESFENFKGKIPLVLGKDTIGNEVMVDLAKMPHLLIAGSTGSGKSVALNTFLISMLCKLTPDQLKLILIDPKRLEFASYVDIPHLLFPIITDPRRTAPILRWVVNQMEERYEKMAKIGARNIFDYNELLKKEDELPFIVIVIDELSDLMMTTGKDIEDLIARIAQMARAAGIHMIVATQRPSVDVITGLIKVNFPSRISFRVTSKVDSRTILDYCGAEKLLGSGDMLFLDSGSSTLRRLHGAYISNKEIDDLASHIRAERKVQYLDISSEFTKDSSELSEADDILYEDVLEFLGTTDEVSISLLQRKFRIGYNRSARIIDILESRGVVMPSEGSKMRKVIR